VSQSLDSTQVVEGGRVSIGRGWSVRLTLTKVVMAGMSTIHLFLLFFDVVSILVLVVGLIGGRHCV